MGGTSSGDTTSVANTRLSASSVGSVSTPASGRAAASSVASASAVDSMGGRAPGEVGVDGVEDGEAGVDIVRVRMGSDDRSSHCSGAPCRVRGGRPGPLLPVGRRAVEPQRSADL
jgi:hypothetical protein